MDEGKDMIDGSAVHMVRLSRPRRWAALCVLLLGMMVLSLDMTIMDIALPSIAKELHPTADQQLWMVDVYSLALAGLLVSASSISDRIGRKKMFAAGSLAFCAASALVLVVDTSNGAIAVSMALSGLSMGAFYVGSTVIMCATPPESASSGAAFEEIAYDIGNVLGVAFLGSVAGIIYRAGFSVEQLAGLGLSDAQIADALGSYGGAVAVAQETGVAELITQGALSFNESLVFSALAGGILLIVLALVVGRLIPKGFSIAEED